MSNILCIETSTTNCSVAISKGNTILALEEDYNTSYSHAERLHSFISSVQKKSGIDFKEISAVAVSKGPGSYTGLRIGVSAAKGICYALDIPLIATPTLQTLALQVDTLNSPIIPMIDARRMEVYSAVYLHGKEIRETKAEILDELSFTGYLQKDTVHFIGNGVEKFEEICTHKNAIFIKGKLPSAKEMIPIAFDKFQNKEFENVTYFDPYYLKEFVTG